MTGPRRWDECAEIAPDILKLHKAFQGFDHDVKAMVVSYDFVLLLVEDAWYSTLDHPLGCVAPSHTSQLFK